MKAKKLPKRFKANWIKALLSGEFIQYTGGLYRYYKDQKQACCLGVAGFVAGHTENQIRGSCENSFPNDLKKVPKILYSPDYPTYACDNSFKPRSVGEKLALMNDKGKSFKEIADYIKRYL